MRPYLIDCLQYANWCGEVFRQLRTGGVDAIHATVAYHGSFREMVLELEAWNRRFAEFPDLVMPGRAAQDVELARRSGRTAVFFGLQNPSPIEDDLGLVEICHALGIRFMQLSYNNQSLLAAGYLEERDTGLTRMGREAIAEMNRVGMVVDMSHSGERSTLEAIELSARPVAVTHANPASWHDVPRNKSDAVLRALAESGGMLGFSLYPHHLRDGPDCALGSFCDMVARTAGLMGPERIGIGSDLCQGQPDGVVRWMRSGRWTREADPGGGFPAMPAWFRDNRDFGAVEKGLRAAGMGEEEVAGAMGGNWFRFFGESFGPA